MIQNLLTSLTKTPDALSSLSSSIVQTGVVSLAWGGARVALVLIIMYLAVAEHDVDCDMLGGGRHIADSVHGVVETRCGWNAVRRS